MTTKSLFQLAVLAVLAVTAFGCSRNGRLLRRSHDDDCDTCHYGCCDGMGGDDCSCGCGSMGCGTGPMGGGGCMSCGQAPDLMPIGPQAYEQVPSQPIGPSQTYQSQPIVPSTPRGLVRPGPVE